MTMVKYETHQAATTLKNKNRMKTREEQHKNLKVLGWGFSRLKSFSGYYLPPLIAYKTCGWWRGWGGRVCEGWTDRQGGRGGKEEEGSKRRREGGRKGEEGGGRGRGWEREGGMEKQGEGRREGVREGGGRERGRGEGGREHCSPTILLPWSMLTSSQPNVLFTWPVGWGSWTRTSDAVWWCSWIGLCWVLGRAHLAQTLAQRPTGLRGHHCLSMSLHTPMVGVTKAKSRQVQGLYQPEWAQIWKNQ